MAQSFRKAALTTAAIAGFASLSVATEPLVFRTIDRTEVTTQRNQDDDANKSLAVTGLLTVGLGFLAYAMTRKRSMFGDDDRQTKDDGKGADNP
jgi:hypothetical protein